MHRFTRVLRAAPVALLGVGAALGAAGLTQAQSGGGPTTPTQSVPSTAPTVTVPATTTTPKTTPKATPRPRATRREITCRAKLIAVKQPVASAEDYGTVKCSAPFGKGVQHNTATVARSAPTAGTFTGSFKIFLNEGTLRGTFKMTFTVAAGATYTGTLKVSSGTGDHLGVKGTGTITGTSSDGVNTTLRQKLTLTVPRASRR